MRTECVSQHLLLSRLRRDLEQTDPDKASALRALEVRPARLAWQLAQLCAKVRHADGLADPQPKPKGVTRVPWLEEDVLRLGTPDVDTRLLRVAMAELSHLPDASMVSLRLEQQLKPLGIIPAKEPEPDLDDDEPVPCFPSQAELEEAVDRSISRRGSTASVKSMIESPKITPSKVNPLRD